jgi:hypothetical protein
MYPNFAVSLDCRDQFLPSLGVIQEFEPICPNGKRLHWGVIEYKVAVLTGRSTCVISRFKPSDNDPAFLCCVSDYFQRSVDAFGARVRRSIGLACKQTRDFEPPLGAFVFLDRLVSKLCP